MKKGNRQKSNEKFISEAMFIHSDKYEYNKVNYMNAKVKVVIICPEHGDFEQTPDSHLRGSGCPKCGQIKKAEGFKRTKNLQREWNFKQPDEYKLIPLTQGKFSKVDNEDFDKLKNINWSLTEQGYGYNRELGLIHRYIMNAPEHLDVDHKEHDTLDNRKSNLRLATRAQNMANLRPKVGSSRYKGVSWCETLNKWRACITFNYNWYFIGYFTDEKESGIAYDKKALELQGEFAYLNFPELKDKYLKELENEN